MSTDLLSPEHRRALEQDSAITSEVIAARGYRTVTDRKELATLGFSPVQCRVPGLLIPLHAPDGTPAGYQFRPDSPRTNRQGKVIKYELPKGSGIRIDCPPVCQPQVADPAIPLSITEGAKKADSLASQGLCALDLLGVWGFKGKNPLGGVTVLADMDAVALDGRLVSVIFDSDAVTKPQVDKALKRLTEHLSRRKAQVRHVYLPGGPNGEKVGVDDFLATGHTVKDLEALAQAPDEQPQVQFPLVQEELPDAPVTRQARVPRPYRLKLDSLYELRFGKDKVTGEEYEAEVLVASAPVLITSRCQDVDSWEYDLELAWRSQETWHGVTVRRDVATDHRKLPSVALNGVPVTSLNAKALTAYLAAYEHLNLNAIPKTLVTRRCGWREVEGRLGFVLGKRVIGVDTVRALQTGTAPGELMGEDALRLLADNAGTSTLAAALHVRGTFEGWRGAMELMVPFPRVLLGIYASLTPPLLSILDAPNFIMDYCGDTSIGKTATQHGAASVWGFPPGEQGGLVVSWNTTQVFAERYAELLNDLPVLLEDSQIADPRTLARTIYMLANGVGRGRGSPRGLHGVTRWRGVTISSGERPFHAVTQEGGARARVITLWGSPLGSLDHGSLVRQFKAAVAQHHGHAGPAFVAWLLAYQGQWKSFRDLYSELTDTLARNFPGSVGDRYASYFAAMLVAGMLATPVIGLPSDPEAVIRTVMGELAEPQEEADTPRRALVDFIGWATGSRGLFEGMDDPDRPPHTYLGRWEDGQYIAVFPYQARAQLARMGYSVEAILRSWRERGWLKVQDDRYTYRLRVRGLPQHMTTLEWAAIEQAGAPMAATVP